MGKMTTREIFDAYFKNGDEFVYTHDDIIQARFQVHDIQPNHFEMAVHRISSPGRPLMFFYKVGYDIPYIYKVIQNFKR